MPGWAQNMRAQDGTLAKGPLYSGVGRGFQAESDSPFRGWIVLGLDSAKPLNGLLRLLEGSQCNTLIIQALVNNVQCRHWQYPVAAVYAGSDGAPGDGFCGTSGAASGVAGS